LVSLPLAPESIAAEVKIDRANSRITNLIPFSI
jgi:hypothetical protein